jgi:hypothetical protein
MESRKEEMHLRKKESESAQLMSTNVSMAMAAATDTYMMEMLENMKEKNRPPSMWPINLRNWIIKQGWNPDRMVDSFQTV